MQLWGLGLSSISERVVGKKCLEVLKKSQGFHIGTLKSREVKGGVGSVTLMCGARSIS